MQYFYALSMGRIGAELSVERLSKDAEVVCSWYALFNDKGIDIIRASPEGGEVKICDFSTLLNPCRIEEDELHLLDMLSGAPVEEDHDVVKLCSFLVAKWAGGHSEESFHNVIQETLKSWSK